MYSATDTLVDDIAQYYDNTDLSTVQDATRRQGKIMQYVNRARDEIWWMRPWVWTWKEAVISMSGGQGNHPADFAQVGTNGGLYDQANGRPWSEVNFQEMETLRHRTVRVNDRLFAVGGGVISIPNTGSSESFDLVYRMQPTNLTYGEDLDPVPYHFGHALLLGAVARLKEEEGDPRPIWRDDFRHALSRAMVTERDTASRVNQMPMAVGRKW